MALGVFSSMSSGPMLAAMLAIVFIAFYRFRRYWKIVVAVVILMCGSIEIISSRHFYDILGRFTLSPATAWYRSKLIDVALFQGGMSGHWLTGYGFADPGWSAKIDNRNHTDVVNHYLLILCRYGVMGLIPFIALIILAFNAIIKAFQMSILEEDRWLIWCLAGALFGLLVAMLTVSLFGPPISVLFILLGFCGGMPQIIKQTNYQQLQCRPETRNILPSFQILQQSPKRCANP
jgi:O-antigen ligase